MLKKQGLTDYYTYFILTVCLVIHLNLLPAGTFFLRRRRRCVYKHNKLKKHKPRQEKGGVFRYKGVPKKHISKMLIGLFGIVFFQKRFLKLYVCKMHANVQNQKNIKALLQFLSEKFQTRRKRSVLLSSSHVFKLSSE